GGPGLLPLLRLQRDLRRRASVVLLHDGAERADAGVEPPRPAAPGRGGGDAADRRVPPPERAGPGRAAGSARPPAARPRAAAARSADARRPAAGGSPRGAAAARPARRGLIPPGGRLRPQRSRTPLTPGPATGEAPHIRIASEGRHRWAEAVTGSAGVRTPWWRCTAGSVRRRPGRRSGRTWTAAPSATSSPITGATGTAGRSRAPTPWPRPPRTSWRSPTRSAGGGSPWSGTPWAAA